MPDPIPAPLPTLSPQVFHILAAIADTERHGYGIIQEVEHRTAGELRLSASTLYGAIKRMLQAGLVAESQDRPAPDQDDERRRYYRITPLGQRTVRAEAARIAALADLARSEGLV